MITPREDLAAIGVWTANDELRHKLASIRAHGNWREAMRNLLAGYGIDEREIETRINALTAENTAP